MIKFLASRNFALFIIYMFAIAAIVMLIKGEYTLAVINAGMALAYEGILSIRDKQEEQNDRP